MLYTVYRTRVGGNPQKLAETLYRADAENVLKNWHSGYIASNGDIVHTKNYDPASGHINPPKKEINT